MARSTEPRGGTGYGSAEQCAHTGAHLPCVHGSRIGRSVGCPFLRAPRPLKHDSRAGTVIGMVRAANVAALGEPWMVFVIPVREPVDERRQTPFR